MLNGDGNEDGQKKKKNRSKSTIKQATKNAQFVLQPSCKTS